MKIVLAAINAKYIHSNPAVYSLAAYAGEYLAKGEKENITIEIAEYTINQQGEKICADLYKRKPDVIGFSCYIWNWEMVQQVMGDLHLILPDTMIYLGGPEVSYTADEIMDQYPYLAGIMMGEGEETFLNLCRFYGKEENKGKAPALPLLYSRITEEKGRGREHGEKSDAVIPAVVNMNDIPFFYHDLTEFNNRIIYYESSRGCPYRCSYCLSSIDKHLRFRDLNTVKKELKFFLDRKVPQVKFIDRTFNIKKDHAKEILSFLLEHDNGITNFHFEIAADILTEEELNIMEKMRPGLIQLEIGVQTTNLSVLEEIGRKTNLDRLKENVRRIKNMGNIHNHLDLIAGLPLEGKDSFISSFNDVYAMRPDQLQLGFLKVLKGSPMWVKAKEYGIVYSNRPPYQVLSTRWLSYDDILLLQRVEEMVEMYYNSDQFNYTLSMLVKEFPHPFACYEALAEYYRNGGYDLQQPARSYRYRILFDFCRAVSPEKEEMYKELLIFDLYLREKIKTRPEYLPEHEEKERISRAVYIKEEEERSLLPAYKEYRAKQLSKMTHLEVFTYKVWEMEGCEKLSESIPVMFDYKERNPLTNEAKIIFIEKL